jgi:hypothetical protein
MIGSAFASINREKAIVYMNQVLGEIEGLSAVHCCANTDWSLVLNSDIDVLNFDAFGYSDHFLLYAGEVIDFLNKGGILAWGIVPTNKEDLERESATSLMIRLENAMKKLSEKGISMDKITESSIITPSCGLGPSTVECAERALSMLKQISGRMREKYGY